MRISGVYSKEKSMREAAEIVFGNLESAKGVLLVRIDKEYSSAKSIAARLNALGLDVAEINFSEGEATVFCEHELAASSQEQGS